VKRLIDWLDARARAFCHRAGGWSAFGHDTQQVSINEGAAMAADAV
jgi:hypothetical protein